MIHTQIIFSQKVSFLSSPVKAKDCVVGDQLEKPFLQLSRKRGPPRTRDRGPVVLLIVVPAPLEVNFKVNSLVVLQDGQEGSSEFPLLLDGLPLLRLDEGPVLSHHFVDGLLGVGLYLKHCDVAAGLQRFVHVSDHQRFLHFLEVTFEAGRIDGAVGKSSDLLDGRLEVNLNRHRLDVHGGDGEFAHPLDGGHVVGRVETEQLEKIREIDKVRAQSFGSGILHVGRKRVRRAQIALAYFFFPLRTATSLLGRLFGLSQSKRCSSKVTVGMPAKSL